MSQFRLESSLLNAPQRVLLSRADLDNDANKERIRLAVPNIVPKGIHLFVLAQNLTSVVTSEVSRFKVFQVTSYEDIINMLDHEQKKQLVGCESDVSCLTEIGGAMGVEMLITGSVGKLGSEYIVNLQLINVIQAKVESREEVKITGTEEELGQVVRTTVKRLVRPLLEREKGFLDLECSEEGADVKIDDDLIGTTPLKKLNINWGPHTIRVTKEGFVPFSKGIDVESGQVISLGVKLIPSMEYIKKYESRAKTYRALAWTTTGLAGAGLIFAGIEGIRALDAEEDHENLIRRLNEEGKLTINPGGDYTFVDGNARKEYAPQLAKMEDRGNSATTWARIGLAGGAIMAGAALYFWLDSGDPNRYEGYKQASAFLVPSTNGMVFGVNF